MCWQVPINVDVDCTDNERIQHLQICQAASEDDGQAGTITSVRVNHKFANRANVGHWFR